MLFFSHVLSVLPGDSSFLCLLLEDEGGIERELEGGRELADKIKSTSSHRITAEGILCPESDAHQREVGKAEPKSWRVRTLPSLPHEIGFQCEGSTIWISKNVLTAGCEAAITTRPSAPMSSSMIACNINRHKINSYWAELQIQKKHENNASLDIIFFPPA